MNVVVFGGAEPGPGDPAYEVARDLGRMLARAGHTVISGGYIGTMEAVSRGAAEAGGHVVGVTCAEIERWRNVRPNEWVREEWKAPTLMERLKTLVYRGDAAIALPGGAGTLAEVTLLWNLMLIEAVPRRPLVLVGPEWSRFLGALLESLGTYIPGRSRALLSLASDARAAVDAISSTRDTEGGTSS